MKKQKKCIALEKLLGEGWFDSEAEALPWIMARAVLVNDTPLGSAKERIPIDSTIRVKEYYKRRYVNKGGLKLEGALRDFSLDIAGLCALDCGASTGGFTDCLLQHGAAPVYAVDVGFGQLAGKLQACGDVVNLERTNLSDPRLFGLSPAPQIITLDLSYLTLRKAVPACREILHGEGIIVALIKPLFEVDPDKLREAGDIHTPSLLKDMLEGLCQTFLEQGFSIRGVTNSPIRGNSGTLEYFACLECGIQEPPCRQGIPMDQIDGALERSFTIQEFKKNGTVTGTGGSK